MQDLDYLNKLSDEDKEWMRQFMLEYYQGDFNFDNPIHPKELRKDCTNRNNSSKRQLHSVGQDKLEEAAKKARAFQKIRTGKDIANKLKFYTPEDWDKSYSEELLDEVNYEDLKQISEE